MRTTGLALVVFFASCGTPLQQSEQSTDATRDVAVNPN